MDTFKHMKTKVLLIQKCFRNLSRCSYIKSRYVALLNVFVLLCSDQLHVGHEYSEHTEGSEPLQDGDQNIYEGDI